MTQYFQSFAQYAQASTEFLKQMQSPHWNERLLLAENLLCSALERGLPVLVCGNGGSAADAIHIAGELVGRFLINRQALNVIALNTDVAVLTAVGNDLGYERIFSRQVEAYAKQGGVFWGLSTSGNSPTVLAGAQTAKNCGMSVLAMTGDSGGQLGQLADVLINVPSQFTPLIQQGHQVAYHYLCAAIEKRVGIPESHHA
jgi:D-sedoheptulose 7-phosphate isomerase